MKNLFLTGMLVLCTSFAMAQDNDDVDMPMDMEMPMDMPDMGMLAEKVSNAFSIYKMSIDKASMVCKTMCTEKDMMISDLKMYKKHSEMVLSKRQMMKIKEMIMMEMDMKMNMDKTSN